MSLRSWSLVLIASSALAGCAKSSDGGAARDAGGGDAGADAGLAACHAAPVQATCTTAPANLDPNDPLQPGFLQDVFNEVGLDGTVGWRVTFGDLDGDGYPDFFTSERTNQPGHQHLFMNRPNPDGGGRVFVETTQESGIQVSRMEDGGLQVGYMAAFADIDNDGDLDLFQGSYSQDPSGTKYVPQPNEIYLNDGTGHFTLKRDAHIADQWPLTTSSATFLDYDKDGKLDLFLGNFMVSYPNLDAYPNLLFKGDGTGAFTDVSASAGVAYTGFTGDPSGNFRKATYGVTSCDYDNDGWTDVLTSSYALEYDDLFRNKGDGTFENTNQATGYWMDDIANPAESQYRWGGNSFAAACADYDNDGDLDVFVAQTTHGDYPRNFGDRSKLYVNTGADGGYTFVRPDRFQPNDGGWGGTWTSTVTGINRDLIGTSGPDAEYGDEGDHGAAWADLDNDGLLDLIIEASAYQNTHAWIYHQRPDHSFENVTELSGMAAQLGQTNGMTIDDYNRDGRLDILSGSVFVNNMPPPGGVEQLHLFENRVANGNHWLHITLHGTTANRQGIGAKVHVTAGCLTQLREISGGKGTFGAADPAYAHFGLGKTTVVDKIVVEWPTNPVKVQTLTNVAVDQFLEITEDSDQLSCQAPH